ncbi:MAG: SMP-30/gluconolactonase/LRE family protein [Nitratireductor sp.]
MRTLIKLLLLAVVALAGYMSFWPVPVVPVAWEAPKDNGFTGAYALNERLASLDFLDLGGESGPEDTVEGRDGMIYAAVHDGKVLRIDPASNTQSVFAETGGRPLGMEFGADGTLFVADANRGLLAITPDGKVKLLTDKTSDGSAILYADDLDVTASGVVYFSDASTRFSASSYGNTLTASILDLVEHSGNGRVLKFDPATGETTVFADGLNFPNGIALTPDGSGLIVAETGGYRILRYDPADAAKPPVEIISNLPGFPDNVNRGANDTFLAGLTSPRNAIVDKFSDKPFFRAMLLRLPDFLKPAPTRHGFILRFDQHGNVIETLQDPSGAYALTTGGIDLGDGSVVVTSLSEPRLGILRK